MNNFFYYLLLKTLAFTFKSHIYIKNIFISPNFKV